MEAYDGPQIVGMDLHRRRSVLVRMTEDGRKLATARITNSPARLAAEIRRAGLHPKVVLEACYGWYWAADTLAAAGAEVHLAHPLGVKAFSHRRVKNDELDARDLADLLRMGRLAEAWIAPPEIRELREITRYRGKLVHIRTSCKDQVHGVLAKLGIEVTCSDIFGAWGTRWLDELPLPQPYSWKVASLRQLIGWLTSEITVLEQVTADLLAGHDAYRAVQQLPGIGPVLGRGHRRRDRRHHPVPPPGPAVLVGRADPAALRVRHHGDPRPDHQAGLTGRCAGRWSRRSSAPRLAPRSARPGTPSSPAAAPRRATSPRSPRPASCSPTSSTRCATGTSGPWTPPPQSTRPVSRPGRGQRVIASVSGPRPARRPPLLIDPAARADQPHAPRPRAAGHPEG